MYFTSYVNEFGTGLFSFYANTPAQGSVDISGAVVEGVDLIAVTNITDIDGVGALNFQWFRNGEIVHDATEQSYKVLVEDVGHTLNVEVNYYDNEGNFEQMLSTAVTVDIDTDSDGIGNNEDSDDDNDGIADTVDAFPLDATETVDTDSDGIGNNADTDDDNDGIPDLVDAFPLDATRSQVETKKSSSGGSTWLLIIGLLLVSSYRVNEVKRFLD